MGNIGLSGGIIIFVIALIVFGPKKLPELGRAVGTTLREFKQSTKGIIDDHSRKRKINRVVHRVKDDEPPAYSPVLAKRSIRSLISSRTRWKNAHFSSSVP